MWPSTKLTQLFNIRYPVVQGPMAGANTPKLVAAVSNAGGLGSLGAGLMPPVQIQEAIREIRALTTQPFAVNLFIPEMVSACSAEDIAKVSALYNHYRQELDIAEVMMTSPPTPPSFDEQLAVILAEKVPIFSFTFGVLPSEFMRRLKDQNVVVIGTATTIREAKLLERSGVDAIVAQGSEAGGHRGSCSDTVIEDALIGGMALIPQIVDHVKLPVIASGGIMDGRGIVAALVLGAAAVQMGTAFLSCPESSIHAKHRELLMNSTDESTRLTKAFTGKTARSIKNRLLLEMAPYSDNTLPFHLHRAALKDIPLAAAAQNKAEFLPLWSGQAASLCRAKPAGELVETLAREVEKLLNRVS